MSADPNRPIDWAALQCAIDMGKAGVFCPAEVRVRIGMVLSA